MACPFFHPSEPFEDGAWLKSPRLPLGEPCRGECTAGPSPFEPPLDRLRELCNLGYARGRCERFPADAPSDAVRFSVAGTDAGRVSFVLIFEADYSPARHAAVEYDVQSQRFSPDLEDANVSAQARQFVGSYLKRRIEV